MDPRGPQGRRDLLAPVEMRVHRVLLEPDLVPDPPAVRDLWGRLEPLIQALLDQLEILGRPVRPEIPGVLAPPVHPAVQALRVRPVALVLLEHPAVRALPDHRDHELWNLKCLRLKNALMPGL